jgi:3-hydroxyacyl-[acyl-carrier-protein] dehydratase
VYPGDTTTVEVRRKETMGDFHFLTGTMRSGDQRVMHVEFSVAWKTPGRAGGA